MITSQNNGCTVNPKATATTTTNMAISKSNTIGSYLPTPVGTEPPEQFRYLGRNVEERLTAHRGPKSFESQTDLFGVDSLRIDRQPICVTAD